MHLNKLFQARGTICSKHVPAAALLRAQVSRTAGRIVRTLPKQINSSNFLHMIEIGIRKGQSVAHRGNMTSKRVGSAVPNPVRHDQVSKHPPMSMALQLGRSLQRSSCRPQSRRGPTGDGRHPQPGGAPDLYPTHAPRPPPADSLFRLTDLLTWREGSSFKVRVVSGFSFQTE